MTATPVRRTDGTAFGGIVVTATRGRRSSVVRVHGDLDTAGTARVARVCAGFAPTRGSSVVLDLEGVTFAGSAAVAFIDRLRSDLDVAGAHLVLRPSDQIRRLLEIVT